MENSASTSDYAALCESRLSELKTLLGEALEARGRITLEVGCGHGHFLTAYAAAHPESFCVGIDLIIDRISRAERKRNRATLDNLIFVQAEARDFLKALPAGVALADVFILFPDPWPKRRHHKNRVLQPAFLSTLAAKAEYSARLYFRTDYAPYLTAAKDTLAAHSDWKLDDSALWPFELETVFQSRAHSYDSLIASRKLPTPTGRGSRPPQPSAVL